MAAAAASGPRRAVPSAAPSGTRSGGPSWDELIQWRLARGEETALGELYDRFAPLVHGLAGCILDDRMAAQQLTREVFAHLWEHPDSFDPTQGSLRSWLGALTRHRALDRLRTLHADDRELRARAGAARAQSAVAALPDPLRETLAVTYFDGRTYQETALRLGISEQDTKQRIRLGLQLLADQLGDGGQGEEEDDGGGVLRGEDEQPDANPAAGRPPEAGSSEARVCAERTSPTHTGPGRRETGLARPARPHREPAHTEFRHPGLGPTESGPTESGRTDAAGAGT
ncbi:MULTISPECIES: sigma-70 family RNA polymerase sigma factor [Kitasatospora]|uniref:Uncharacterized protein n=1 Tax=Kitasatospora cystarginea TaxID=58350 RepID=A0ABN3EAQ4_9ACTN